MDTTGYTTLTRQSGLMHEMRALANNIANLGTTGFRAESVIFTEHVRALGESAGSLSMATAAAHATAAGQGALTRTGGAFDLAIEGPGFFQLETPAGPRLTRAGAFLPNAAGELSTPDGYRLLDAGGAPIFVPPDAAAVTIAADGTLSADGRPLAQIGLVQPESPVDLRREDGVRFRAKGPLAPVESPVIQQGFLEQSNVDPVIETARMIEVQRGYELGQAFLEREDERIRNVLRTLGK
ncbi:flagellar hook-basal body complex protein [Rhodovulum sp. YNF3179]|uniref:flagellar hook-basal body complex protein n=1 Tax=Rhodovulum sp. YNF3179 TaxID=3425127 RepID=UPI003D355D11